MKKIIFIFSLILILSSCGAEDITETPAEKKSRLVSSYTVQEQNMFPLIEISGTLKAKTEANINAETSGTILTMNYKEGDFVNKGDILLVFDSTGNQAQINLSTAQSSFNNMQNLYDLTLSATSGSENSARVAVEQAEIALGATKKTDSSTGISIDEQIKSASSAVETAKVNLSLAENGLKSTQENLLKQEENLKESVNNGYSSALISLENGLRSADEILGITDQNASANNNYEGLLSVRNSSLLHNAKLQFKVSNTSIDNLDGSLDSVIKSAKEIRELLNQVDEILQNTITGANFSSTELGALKTTISTHKSTIEGQISTVTNLEQSISDFDIQSPQQLEAKELALSLAESSLSQTEHNLENIKASLDTQRVGTSSQIEIAEKSLESAESNFENIKKQNALNVQNAKTALDNARKQLDSAGLAFSKLKVTSPISGFISSSEQGVGNTVSMGTLLFNVAEIDTLTLEGEISVEKASQIQLNDPAFIEEKEAKISKISPSANLQTRKIKVEIEIDNKSHELFANTFATANILGESYKSLAVPIRALVDKNPPKVYVIKGDTIEGRIITLGERGEKFVEILDGLESGEIIVAERMVNLNPGDKIKLP